MMLDHRYDNVRVTHIMPGSVDTEFSGGSRRQSRLEDSSRGYRGDCTHVVENAGKDSGEPGRSKTFKATEVRLLRWSPKYGMQFALGKYGVVVKGAQKKMSRVNVPLDPTRTGRDAEALEGSLRRMIVGQDEAIQQIVNIYQMHLTGMTPSGRPIGNFLFLGPTGSGKTRIVEATAEALVTNPRAVIKIDCAEFQHSHEIAKLIGSPPGYLGHRETHPLLSQEVLNQYHTETCKLSFVLFDEIEKASDALWNLLLGILDKGTLTLGDNRKVDFSRALIFMTSNLGATEMSALMNPKLGFQCGGERAAIPERNRGRKAERQNGTQRRRSSAPQIHAGVHQPAG